VTFSAVQRRDLTLVAILRGVSYLGDAIALIALYLRLAHGADASWAIASLSVAASLPLVVLSPISGFINRPHSGKSACWSSFVFSKASSVSGSVSGTGGSSPLA